MDDMARKAKTTIVIRKAGYSVIKYGRVVFSHRDPEVVKTFIEGFDPELAATNARIKARRHASFAQTA
jgi:hypothetical protein